MEFDEPPVLDGYRLGELGLSVFSFGVMLCPIHPTGDQGQFVFAQALEHGNNDNLSSIAFERKIGVLVG